MVNIQAYNHDKKDNYHSQFNQYSRSQAIPHTSPILNHMTIRIGGHKMFEPDTDETNSSNQNDEGEQPQAKQKSTRIIAEQLQVPTQPILYELTPNNFENDTTTQSTVLKEPIIYGVPALQNPPKKTPTQVQTEAIEKDQIKFHQIMIDTTNKINNYIAHEKPSKNRKFLAEQAIKSINEMRIYPVTQIDDAIDTLQNFLNILKEMSHLKQSGRFSKILSESIAQLNTVKISYESHEGIENLKTSNLKR